MSEVKIVEIEEHEDGSATFQVECDPQTFAAIFNVGFVALVKAGLETEKEKQDESSRTIFSSRYCSLFRHYRFYNRYESSMG